MKHKQKTFDSMHVFDIQVAMHRDKFLYYNQLEALISQIYFWNKTLHVSDSSSVHRQEFFTVHTAMVYVLQVCCVYSEKLLMMDRGTVRNMQSFITKINFRN